MDFEVYEPQIPEQPAQPAGIPMVYVSEPVAWEYKQLMRHLEKEGLLEEEALNKAGEEGWELAAAITHGDSVYYIFKRVAT